MMVQLANKSGLGIVGAVATALAFFAAMAPTLRWMEFSSGSENLVVATALETRRTGHWMIPTLQGQPRIAKPPLAGWLAAATISQGTLNRMDNPDPQIRAAAYRQLCWECAGRPWPWAA